MIKSFLFFTVLLLLAVPGLTNAQNLSSGNNIAIVKTEAGTVKGYLQNGIYIYKGIPYATAGRFMPPSKPTGWSGIRSSMAYGPVCPTDPTTTVNDEFEFAFQHNLGYANENCQNLNIWTPQINDQKKRPVMVWLHGGGFTAGSSIELPSYDGENLSKKGNAVIVSINHRLNSLGFLDLSAYGEKYKHAANAGLLDIVMALQWVKQNIAAFGGDPGNVTIFGQSGGGAKVTCLMAAPAAKGLFNKAIVQSGSYLSSFMDTNVSRRVAAAMLDELNLLPAQVDSLATISYSKLNKAGIAAFTKVNKALVAEGKTIPVFGYNWGPVFDGNFLPYQLDDTAVTLLSKNIPLLVGSTINETAPFFPDTRNINMQQAKEILQKRYGDKAGDYILAAKKAYPRMEKPADFTDIDMRFRPGVVRQANMKAVAGAAPVYTYLFTWQSPVNDGIYKSMHCMDLAFQFDNIDRCREMTGGGKDAYLLASKMSQSWLNFAKTGNPNASGLPLWPKYTPDNGAIMLFDTNCEVKFKHDSELLKIAAAK